jgi:hypothetical protein
MMMRKLAVLLMIGSLAGCAEVTKFDAREGGAVYYVDCDNELRLLETCRHAMARTCPNGFEALAQQPAGTTLADLHQRNCIANNPGAPERCTLKRRNDGFFVCR